MGFMLFKDVPIRCNKTLLELVDYVEVVESEA